MMAYRIIAIVLLIGGLGLAWGLYSAVSASPFHLGLDLSGGTHLVYKADTTNIASQDTDDAMEALRDTIERRVNLFGVAEPLVQTERGGMLSGEAQHRLVVELPGVTDTQEAIRLIGETPVLEFRLFQGAQTTKDGEVAFTDFEDPSAYGPAVLTGAHLDRALLQFGQGTSGGLSNEPVVVLEFTTEGTELFASFTQTHVGEVFGIFLDGTPISTPVIREAIPGGSAVISGDFTPESAKELVRNLNYGALPVPIELLSSQTIGATLGEQTLQAGVQAALWGMMLVAIFLILWYRVFGVVAVASLALYIIAMLALFKFLPVTLTAAGIAGFILSVGMAVDANVLIFERVKEELKEGKWTHNAVRDGFARAWPAIRDGNISSLLTAIILFWFGTSMVKGFALVFGMGILVSMVTAIVVSRTLILALGDFEYRGMVRFLFGSGLK